MNTQITSSHLILEYDGDHGGLYEGEVMALEEGRKRLEDDIVMPLPPERNSTPKAKVTEQQRGQRPMAPLQRYVTNDGEGQLYGPKAFERVERQHRTNAGMRPTCMRWNISELVSILFVKNLHVPCSLVSDWISALYLLLMTQTAPGFPFLNHFLYHLIDGN